MNSLVATLHSRPQPSSCDDEVRSFSGQPGQVAGLSSASGGRGINSNCSTCRAPWRLLVPTQSEPVSPPPMTTTFFPPAKICPSTASPATR